MRRHRLRHFLARRRRLVAVLACLGLATALLNTAGTAVAAPTCEVAYSVASDWGGGFGANIVIKNDGPALSSWTLKYSYSGNQRLQQGWSGTWQQSGNQVTVTNATWNGSLATGASVQVGANFTYSGTNSAPTAFTLNGATCNGSGSTTQAAPTVSLTSPSAGQIFVPGSSIPLQANASSPGSIASVAFYASTGTTANTLVGTATASPWSAQWANVPAGDYSLTAVATDNLGQTTTSEPVAITVEGPSILANPTSLTIKQGQTGTFGVGLTTAPTTNVTVSAAVTGDSDLSISSGATLTFTPANWNAPQTVTIAAGTNSASGGGHGTVTLSATGYGSATVAVTEAAAGGSSYDDWFLALYDQIKNPANGYFSPKGIPYHSVETLIVEAPDYGHETTSETYSYWLWLEADYGRVTGDWTGFTNAWSNMDQYMIPADKDQPGQSKYDPTKPAEYGPEMPYPDNYPVKLNSSVPVGSDPLANELKSTYGNSDVYAPVWIMDSDNKYGFGQCEDGTSTPSWINTFQRGPMESTWDTIPQPDCDTFKYGSSNSGFLSLFNDGGGSYSQQYKYTEAPDADARLVQAAYWADTYAKAQGKSSTIQATLDKAAKLGDFLRYSMFDKYFKQIGNCLGSTSCPAGTGKSNEDTYLLSWYYAWGGATDGSWSWRIGGSGFHQGYQNPIAAYALSTDSDLVPKSASAKSDWSTSLTRQLQFYQWLQSSEGAIAGGATDNWGGNYGDVTKPPSGDPTFYGMYYDYEPVWHNPPSNQWFGYQTWPMERVAEYYYATGDATAKSILDKWVKWAESVTTVNASTGTLTLPDTLTWTGQPNTFNPSSPGAANTGLHVSATGASTDLGVASSLAKVYEYYAAKAGDSTAQKAAQDIIDVIHQKYSDSLGYSAPETRTDYKNFTVPYNTTNYEGVYIPQGWSGTYPDGTKLSSSTNTFLSIRPWYTSDPQWSKVQNYLNGGPAPVFNYHRFWAEVDVATAFDTFAQLFPNVAAPAGF